MINEVFPPGHFYSVIPHITKDYKRLQNDTSTKFINLDFNQENHKKVLNEINNYLINFDSEFGHTNVTQRQKEFN